MDKRYFSDKLVKWYEENKRDLPWRHTTRPVQDLVVGDNSPANTRKSGFALLSRGLWRSIRTCAALASAHEQEVLRLWQGLGYYSRARNLHECAQQVVDNYESAFPDTLQGIKKTEGHRGLYRSGNCFICISGSCCGGRRKCFRVLSRVFGIDATIDTTGEKRNSLHWPMN